MTSWGEPVLVGEVVHPSHENIDLNLHSLQTRKFIMSHILWVKYYERKRNGPDCKIIFKNRQFTCHNQAQQNTKITINLVRVRNKYYHWFTWNQCHFYFQWFINYFSWENDFGTSQSWNGIALWFATEFNWTWNWYNSNFNESIKEIVEQNKNRRSRISIFLN